MPTKRQHYVPRVYMKAWETQVETIKEPNKKFNGVYVYDGTNSIEGCSRNSVLWKPHLYTIIFRHWYLCSSCAEVKKYFVEKIYELMRDSSSKKIYGKKGFSIIKTKRSIAKHFFDFYDWDFYYDNGDCAKKTSIVRQVEEMNCYILEDSFDAFFETKWERTLNEFINAVKTGVPVAIGQSERVIPYTVATEMLASFFIMLCRNPQFDAMGIYSRIKERILYPVFISMFSDSDDNNEMGKSEGESYADDLMRAIWYSELYKMFYKPSGGFYHRAIETALNGCQMILFEAYDGAGSFITSDNPAFKHECNIETKNTNGLLFPLSPRFLLFVGKGTDGINHVDYRMANADTVKFFNGIIYRNRMEKVISSTKEIEQII